MTDTTRPTFSPFVIYAISALVTCVLLFVIGLVIWAAIYGIQLVGGANTLTDADLSQVGGVMSALTLLAAALTIGQVVIVPLMPIAVVIFVAISQRRGQDRMLAALVGFGCAEAFGLWLTLTRDTAILHTFWGHLFLFAIPGALAGLMYWRTLGRTRKKMGPHPDAPLS